MWPKSGSESGKTLLTNPSVPARPLLWPLGVISQDGRQHFGDCPGRQVIAVLVLQVAMPRPAKSWADFSNLCIEFLWTHFSDSFSDLNWLN